MKKILFSLLFVLIAVPSLAQLPGPVIGPAVAIPAGSFSCTQQPFGAPIGISGEPSAVTMCFTYYNIGPINLSYLLVNGLCGPFPLYNSLSFQIFDASGTQFITSGTIVPVANNITITSLTPSTWYNICYTWTPNCAQFSACPLIYTSALPIDLLYFNGRYNEENHTVELNWATATEKNTDKFVIEKSDDLILFETVASVNAAGNSTSTSYYQVYDYGKLNKTVYYRLVEKTIDGESIIHNIIAVSNKLIDESISEIYDITGRKLNMLLPGVNVVKQGNAYFKVIQLK